LKIAGKKPLNRSALFGSLQRETSQKIHGMEARPRGESSSPHGVESR
jgi:hypothetical protein